MYKYVNTSFNHDYQTYDAPDKIKTKIKGLTVQFRYFKNLRKYQRHANLQNKVAKIEHTFTP